MPKNSSENSNRMQWYMAGVLITVLVAVSGWSIDHLYSNLKEGQSEIKATVKEVNKSVKENFKEISGLSARIAKLEP